MRIKVGLTNSPESMKKGLIKDRLKRALRIERWSERQRLDFRFIAEGGTYAEKVDEKIDRIKVLWAKVNDYVNGRHIGNGLSVNRLLWKVKLLESIPIGKGEDQVNLGVFFATHRFRRNKFTKLYVIHKPTRRALNKALRPVIDRVIKDHTDRDDANGIPWLAGGDWNGDAPDIGGQLADHGVDELRGSRHFAKIKQEVFKRPLLSDHPFVVATIEFEG